MLINCDAVYYSYHCSGQNQIQIILSHKWCYKAKPAIMQHKIDSIRLIP